MNGPTAFTRETFTIDSPQTFSHLWQRQGSDGSWLLTSTAACKRS